MTNEKIIEKAEKLDWKVNAAEGNYSFSTYSPAGKDFCIELSSPDIETVNNSPLIEVGACNQAHYCLL